MAAVVVPSTVVISIAARRSFPVQLQRPEDSLRDRRGGGDVRAGGVEAVLIRGVSQRDLLAVGSLVGVATFSCHSETFRARGPGSSTLMS